MTEQQALIVAAQMYEEAYQEGSEDAIGGLIYLMKQQKLQAVGIKDLEGYLKHIQSSKPANNN